MELPTESCDENHADYTLRPFPVLLPYLILQYICPAAMTTYAESAGPLGIKAMLVVASASLI